MTLIKNCGLKHPQEVEMAARTGASFVGFVHCPTSPRHLDLATMAALQTYKPETVKGVAVLVNPSDAVLDDIVTLVKPDYIQVHKVGAARAALISERTGLPLIIGIAVEQPSDLRGIATMEAVATHLLFDAKQSGSGTAFDWSLLHAAYPGKPWFLAGGLNIRNIREAIRITRAPMVDVSSGLEDAPGQKSLEKIAAFNAAVLQP